MLAARHGRTRALLSAVALAVATLGGALTVLLLGNQTPGMTGIFLSLAAGSFIYVGASDMIPAVAGRARGNLLLVLAGGGLTVLLSSLLGLVGLE